MTVVCSGGTSQAKSQYSETVALTASATAALLNNIPTVWAVPVAGYLGLITYDLSTFCTSDPPAIPTFTLADTIGAMNPFDPVHFEPALAKYQQLVGAYAWYLFCECSSIATPAPPAAPAAPAGTPQINPPISPPLSGSSACSDVQASFDPHTYFYGSVGGSPVSVMSHLYGSGTGPLVHRFTTLDIPSVPIPAGAVKAEVRVTSQQGATVDGTSMGTVDWWSTSTSSGGALGLFAPAPGGTKALGTGNIPAGSQWFSVDITNYNTGGFVFLIELIFYCSANTGPTALQPCCPPDLVAQTMLDNILQTVQLIQRQAVPFAYVPGTVHSGLSGNGELTVQGLIGVKVVLTAYGSAIGIASGDPAEFFEAGSFAWGGSDGFSAREFITHSPHLSLPAAAGQYTRIGYTLGQGVTATFTELVREP